MAIPYAPQRLYQPDSTIIELIQQAGRDAAQGQRASGQIWGNAIGNLGQIAAGTIRDIAEQKAYAAEQQAKQQMEAPRLQDEATKRRLEIEKMQREAADASKASEDNQNFQNAMQTGTREKVLSMFQGDPVRYKQAEDHFNRIDTHMRTLLAEAAAGIRAFGDDPQAAMAQLDDLAEQGFDPAKIKDMKDRISSDPKQITPLVDSFLVNSPIEEHRKLASMNQKPDSRSLEVQMAAAIAKGDTEGAKKIEDAIRRVSAAGRAPESPDAGLTLTPAAMETAARRYLIDGTLPPMGMGKAGASVRQQIMNRAAELDPSANIAGNKAGYQADSGSLRKLQQQYDAVNAFEGTAKKNAGALDSLLSKLPDSGVRLLNVPLRSLSSQLGSEDMAAINALRQSVQNEYARIISNPTISGVMSDTARKEGEAILAPDMTVGQLRSALKTLAMETGNRKSAYADELETIQGRISGKKSDEGGWTVINGIKIRKKK